MSGKILQTTEEILRFFCFSDSILSYCVQQMQDAVERKKGVDPLNRMEKLQTATFSAKKVQELWRKQKDSGGSSSEMRFFIFLTNRFF